jgi:uncharacterized Zn finger protein (UPF0148 family)
MNNIKKCPECKSENLLLTQDLHGKIFCATCYECGWSKESPEFKALYKEFDDTFKDFDRDSILKTKKKRM